MALLCVVLGTAGAAAQDEGAGPSLSDIREMLLYARYREAIDAAQQYVQRADLSASDRNAGLEVLATAQLATRSRQAEGTLRELYMRDPQHLLSDQGASPTVQAAFQRARETAGEHVQPDLLHDPPLLDGRRAPVIEVRLGERRDAVHEVRVGYRQQGELRYTTVTMDVDEAGVARARLPLSEGHEAYTIEYHIEALAPSGAVLSRLGSETDALALGVPEQTAAASGTNGAAVPPGPGRREDRTDEGGGVLSQWWFWTLAVVIIGGGVAAGVLLTRPDDTTPQGSLGTFRLGE